MTRDVFWLLFDNFFFAMFLYQFKKLFGSFPHFRVPISCFKKMVRFFNE